MTALATCTGLLAACLTIAGVAGASASTDTRSDATAEHLTLDGQSGGRVFDGIGATSSSSSKLLRDYPARERNQILDYLFKPNYGASLQLLEVEIGSDANSTTLAEPSHMRTADRIDCDRGWEWWLMAEAKRRNPDIKLWGLMWGAPGWTRSVWSQQHIDYILSWLDCAAQHGLTIDYIGGSNERGNYSKAFWIALDDALEARFPDVKTVGPDQHVPPNYWSIASDMRADQAFNDAIDVVGVHETCEWRTWHQTCHGPDAPSWSDAMALDKPLWDSSTSTQDVDAGAGPLIRSHIRSYIQARITAHNNWAVMWAAYGNMWTGGTGLLAAEWPWSGHYQIGESIWADAHTTQFTEPGWRYLDSASGFLGDGASYVTLRAPDTGDYSVVIESMDATEPETVTLHPTGGLATGPVQLWSTDLASADPARDFEHRGPIEPRNGAYTLTVQPKHIYTLSTTRGQHKGSAAPRATADQRLRLPYREDFDSLEDGGLAPYFVDVNGGFEAAPCGGGRDGKCYRQVITSQPIQWQRGGQMEPTTLMGDPMWWGDHTVSARAMLEGPGHVELLGRVARSNKDALAGYHFKIADDGQWSLYFERQGDSWKHNWRGFEDSDGDGEVDAEPIPAAPVPLASGRASFGVGEWHRLALEFKGDRITALIDGREQATVRAIAGSQTSTGLIGLRSNRWQNAQFDDVAITPNGSAPITFDRAQMRARATSVQPGPLEHQQFSPEWALDGRPETQWMARFQPDVAALPQSITIDLDRPRFVAGLLYKPPVGNTRVDPTGIITGYRVSVSVDGRRFTHVASGTWPTDISSKRVTWERRRPARYVRLEATAAEGGVPGASEIELLADRRGK